MSVLEILNDLSVHILQKSRPVNQNIAFVLLFLAVMPNLQTPFTQDLVPGRLCHCRLKSDMFS
jgi:hypothetical protein